MPRRKVKHFLKPREVRHCPSVNLPLKADLTWTQAATVDGLDECAKDQWGKMIDFFQKTISDLEKISPG
jgi:hypothetical protein